VGNTHWVEPEATVVDVQQIVFEASVTSKAQEPVVVAELVTVQPPDCVVIVVMVEQEDDPLPNELHLTVSKVAVATEHEELDDEVLDDEALLERSVDDGESEVGFCELLPPLSPPPPELFSEDGQSPTLKNKMCMHGTLSFGSFRSKLRSNGRRHIAIGGPPMIGMTTPVAPECPLSFACVVSRGAVTEPPASVSTEARDGSSVKVVVAEGSVSVGIKPTLGVDVSDCELLLLSGKGVTVLSGLSVADSLGDCVLGMPIPSRDAELFEKGLELELDEPNESVEVTLEGTTLGTEAGDVDGVSDPKEEELLE
jgi:hypothetical protein